MAERTEVYFRISTLEVNRAYGEDDRVKNSMTINGDLDAKIKKQISCAIDSIVDVADDSSDSNSEVVENTIERGSLGYLFEQLRGQQIFIDYEYQRGDRKGDRIQRVICLRDEGCLVREDDVVARCTFRSNAYRTFKFEGIHRIGVFCNGKIADVI